jgi:uncharacterized Zn-finger protein
MKKLNAALAMTVVLVATALLILVTASASPAQGPEEIFFPLVFRSFPKPDLQHLTFWSGELRIFALQDNVKVEIYDLDTGEYLDPTDPRIEATNFNANPFVLAKAGDAFEGIGGRGEVTNEIRVRIVATEVHDSRLGKPILVWTGSLDDSIRHPPSPPGPANARANAWMSYIPAIPESRGVTPSTSRELGRDFLGFTSREMYLFARRGPEPTVISIEDLVTNTDADSDDSQTLGPFSAALAYADQELEVYYLNQFEDDTVRIASNVDLSVLVGFGSMARRDWTVTPPSYAVGDGGSEKGTLFYTYASAYVTVFPLEDDTEVTITDLSDGDDSKTVMLTNGGVGGAYDLYTPVLDSPQNGVIDPRGSAPAVNIITNGENPFDNDYVKIESTKPVLIYVGPVASDYEEFADMAFAVPTEGEGRIIYAYAQNFGDREGASNDLQIFGLDDTAVVTITSLSHTTAFRNDGESHNGGSHDFVIGPGIGQCPPQDGRTYVRVQPWCRGTGDGGVWWGSGAWSGEMIRIESTADLVVVNGDFDKIHFGAYTPFVVTPSQTPVQALIITKKEVAGVDDDVTPFDFTLKGEALGTSVDEAFSLTHGAEHSQPVFSPGTYTITEDLPEGWALTDISCEGGSVTVDAPHVAIDVFEDETVICTFTNAPKPSITAKKQVVGAINDTTPFGFSFDGQEFSLRDHESRVFAALDPGTYTIAEEIPVGWGLIDISCEGGSVSVGLSQVTVDLKANDTVECTFTNIPVPAITVKKRVVGVTDDTTPFDFVLDGRDFSLKHGQLRAFAMLPPDTYTVSELVPDGWALADITCSGGSVDIDTPHARIDLGPTDSVVCTFSNSPTPALEVRKEVTGIEDTLTVFDFKFGGEEFGLRHSESRFFGALDPGTYTVTELVPQAWALDTISCDNGVVLDAPDPPQVSVDLKADDYVVCTFANSPGPETTGSVEIKKAVTGVEDNATAFEFSFDGQTFSLKNGESERFESLEPGAYVIAELVPDGWALTDITCEGGAVTVDSPQAAVDLGAGEHVLCTFTNSPAGSIQVTKEVKGTRDTSQLFDFSVDGESFSLKHGESHLVDGLPSGTYTVIEAVPPSWGLSKISCDNGVLLDLPDPPQVSIDLAPGEHVTCTFENWPITAVELLSFAAEAGAESVTLVWETASEIDTEGFNIWRSQAPDGPYIRLNASLIPARGGAVTGAIYEYTDTDVNAGVTYYYKLDDVDVYGASTFHGPVSATPF